MVDPERVGTCIAGAEVTGRRRGRILRRQGHGQARPRQDGLPRHDRDRRERPRGAHRGDAREGRGGARPGHRAGDADDVRDRPRGRRLARAGVRRHARDRPRRADGAWGDARRRPPHDQPDGAEHGGAARGRRPRRRQTTPSRPDPCSARWSPIARSAFSARKASSRPLAALAGYALLSLALFGRGVLRDGGGSAVGSYGSDQAIVRLVAGLVAACDRARPPPAADEARLRARRLEPRLDELHPGPGAAGLAADCRRRAGRHLRRARAGRARARGLVHLPALPRARHRHAGRAGGRSGLRLRHLRDGRDAQPPQPRAGLHAPAGRPGRRPLSARRRSRTAPSSSASRSASSACLRRSWRRCSGRRSVARSRWAWDSSSPAAAPARLLFRCLLLCALAYAIALVVAAPYLWVALAHPDPLGISGRGFELDLANLIIPTRVTELRPSSLHRLSAELGGNNLTEQLGYVGPVLPAVAGFVLWERRRQPLARVLAATIAIATVCALGSRLVVAGHRTWLELPWTLVDGLPLASHALPARAFVLVWLALAVLVALFLSRAGRARWLVFGLLALTLLPSLDGSLWVTQTRPARALRRGSLALAHPPRRERADHPAQLRRPGHAVAGGVGLRLSHDGRLRVGDAARRAGALLDRARDLRPAAAAVPGRRGAGPGAWSRRSTSCSCAAAGPDRGRASSARLSERRGHPAACSPGGCAVLGRPR